MSPHVSRVISLLPVQLGEGVSEGGGEHVPPPDRTHGLSELRHVTEALHLHRVQRGEDQQSSQAIMSVDHCKKLSEHLLTGTYIYRYIHHT